MIRAFAIVMVMLLGAGAGFSQALKAPPVTVDDRVTSLEVRVAAIEKALAGVTEAAKPKTTETAPAAAQPVAAQKTYTYQYVDGVGVCLVEQTAATSSYATYQSAPTQSYVTYQSSPTVYQSAPAAYPYGSGVGFQGNIGRFGFGTQVYRTCGPNGCR